MRAHSPHPCPALQTSTSGVPVPPLALPSAGQSPDFSSDSSLKCNRIPPQIYWGDWCKLETWLHKLEGCGEGTDLTRRAAPRGFSECPGVPGSMAGPTQSSWAGIFVSQQQRRSGSTAALLVAGLGPWVGFCLFRARARGAGYWGAATNSSQAHTTIWIWPVLVHLFHWEFKHLVMWKKQCINFPHYFSHFVFCVP